MSIKRLEIDISEELLDNLLDYLKNLPNNKVKIKLTNKQDKKDIFLETSGILNGKGIDPIKWQEELRDEWCNR